MNTRFDVPEPQQVESLVGTWRRFGPIGPVYQVVALEPPAGNGDVLMKVRMLETSEEITYPVTDILGDPREA